METYALPRARVAREAPIEDQRSTPEGVGRLAAMRAWGGRAATVGPVEEGEGRRPCRPLTHEAFPSLCRGYDGPGRGPAAGDAPGSYGRALAFRGIPMDGRSSKTAAARRRCRRLSSWRRPIMPDQAEGTCAAGTHAEELPLWGVCWLAYCAPPPRRRDSSVCCVLGAAALWLSATLRGELGVTTMPVFNKLDQSALCRGTGTESGCRRRDQSWWNHGRSSTSPPTFYLRWKRAWYDANSVRDGQPRRGRLSL